jgi:glutaredoxin
MKFIVYSKSSCTWCDKAKALLTRLGYEFEVRDLSVNAHMADFKAHGFMTVPQIYVAGASKEHGLIGGYTDLVEWLASR